MTVFDLLRINVLLVYLVCGQVDVEQWVLVVTNRDHPRALEFFKMYVQCAQVMGIRVAQPAVATIPNDRTETYLQAIRSRLSPQVNISSDVANPLTPAVAIRV